MTRVRWSETEQAEILVYDYSHYYVERVFLPTEPITFMRDVGRPGSAFRGVVERHAKRVHFGFPASYSGPMEADTEWLEVPNHNPDPRAGTYLLRITSVFVGAEYETVFRKGIDG